MEHDLDMMEADITERDEEINRLNDQVEDQRGSKLITSIIIITVE